MNHSCVKIGFFLVINPGSSRVDSLAVSLVAHAKLKNRRLPYACDTSSPLCPRCTMSCHCSCPPLCESLVKCASCRFCVVPWAAEPSLSQLSGDCSGRSTSPIPVLPPSYTLKGVTRVCHTTAQGRKEEERRSGVKEAARSQKWRANSKEVLSGCWGKVKRYCQVVEKKAKRIACVSHCSFLLGCVLDARHRSPCRKGASSERTIMGSTRQMSTTAKQIVDRTMDREKTLGLP